MHGIAKAGASVLQQSESNVLVQRRAEACRRQVAGRVLWQFGKFSVDEMCTGIEGLSAANTT